MSLAEIETAETESLSPVSPTAAGALDLSFKGVVGMAGQVTTAREQIDGKVITCGEFTFINGEERRRIARINPDGSVDPSFDPGTGPNGPIIDAALLADGRVVITGLFFSVNGLPHGSIAILQANGEVDTSFAPAGTGSGRKGKGQLRSAPRRRRLPNRCRT